MPSTRPTLTARQRAWYWREWNAVVRAALRNGWPVPDRHHLHRIALAEYRRQRRLPEPDRESLNDLTNREFDLVIAEFQSWSRPADIDRQISQIRQPTTRLLWKLQRDLPRLLALVIDHPPSTSDADRLNDAILYIKTIANDKFGTADLSNLSPSQLRILVIDTTRAVSQRAAARSIPLHELRRLADKKFPLKKDNEPF
jgi:hypothetical protein